MMNRVYNYTNNYISKINKINTSIHLPTIKQEAHTNAVKSEDVQSALKTNKKETTEIFLNYHSKINEDYNKWIIDYYKLKLIEYESSIDVIEKKICDFRNLFIYIINKISKPIEDAIKLCPICFENEVDICLNPCGHTLCNKCVLSNRSRYTSEKCYSCRTNIQDYIKIYFSL